MIKVHRIGIHTQKIKIQKTFSRKLPSKQIHQDWKHLSMTVELLLRKCFLTFYIFILYSFFNFINSTFFHDLHRLKLKFNNSAKWTWFVPYGEQNTAALQTSRRTGAPCRPTQNTTSATWNGSSHLCMYSSIVVKEERNIRISINKKDF